MNSLQKTQDEKNHQTHRGQREPTNSNYIGRKLPADMAPRLPKPRTPGLVIVVTDRLDKTTQGARSGL